jgi:hypothetical protein
MLEGREGAAEPVGLEAVGREGGRQLWDVFWSFAVSFTLAWKQGFRETKPSSTP